MSVTVILFCVSVPVLSEQITDTHPRLSTAFSSLMMALSAAIFRVPIACTIVTMELSASGIAATASATANMSESSTGCFCQILSANTRAEMIIITMASFFPKSSKLTCNGVFLSCVAFMRSAIFPISVCIPVAVTSTVARPYVTSVPEYTILTRSASAASSTMASSVLSTFADSPVSELSLTCNE